MLKNIFKEAWFFVISLAMIAFSILIGPFSSPALDLPNFSEETFADVNANISSKGDIGLNTFENDDVVEETDAAPTDTNNISAYPDLGDDQVFPFVAGLDAYEAMK
ncbi:MULTISPECIES: hypothetical protein [unclassified Prochlorococcus]|uniref:hypothetical protein n=1 Tax=unclassified Prochlorococcus TaxID=2627481 RepID=UPI000533ADC4|nr:MULTISPECIES: hypothetical protein [unclassified Prochlorococcus]KGG16140.1 hypothetical protein EV06_0850 [Prochlorococcus sp. MIT 0602]KGG17259.1 hypothetical protein EV07_0697 [Prochlorococcus sp. MIT 0603]